MNPLSRWAAAAALAAIAVLALLLREPGEAWLPTILTAAVLLAGAWAVSPAFRGPHTPWSRLREEAARTGGVVIFWRPGCMYCLRMMAVLGPSGRKARWVNIWRDAAAAEFVRRRNGGNETVPTVILAGEVLTNPAPGLVKQALAAG
ncbi:glutaredoxin domain-containing protein [Arthrobacter sp. Marseille-P9274]|uniref:glutaredoxin domain-containing protein n=1 Tax=Arthrobacter sp. Marseille-P9274 TaxID=2866572 RepID=UPI0021C9BB08|nr:glutaredoxin domain-containing protein [Arthrobacter sp. Marseille-P9274]